MPRILFAPLFTLALWSCGSPPPPATPIPTPTAPSASAATAAPVDELDKPLPLDTRVTRGKLDNGLVYYVLPHKKPEKRAQIWLAVNAGSVLEDDDQQGLAHFVEHMCFNGTKRFPKQQLVDFFEKSGVRFGADLNAYTSFDETVYTLQVPTDKTELVDRAFSVLRDWADGVSFDPTEVEKERGVVLEEWRLGRGAGKRIFDKEAPILFSGSKYADRITIGKPEIIKGAARDTLVRYYRDWYRPDLMAVVAVGDFDKAEIEQKIKKEFASLKGPAKERPRVAVTLPKHDKTLVSIETDPEMPSTNVVILSKLPHRPEASARDYRRSIGEHLFNAMLNSRLDEIRRNPDAPFLNAYSSTSGFVRTADAFRQSASVKEDGVERGFSSLLEEVLRVERHGFRQAELDRQKRQMLRTFQQAVKERDKEDGREFAAEIVRNFLEAEAMPGREAELGLVEKFLPTFTLEELNGLGKTLGAGSRVIVVTGPNSIVRPSADSLLAAEKDVEARVVVAYSDSASDVPLLAAPPAPGSVVKTDGVPEIGVTVWTLKNGVRVIVKPTDFSNDEVRMAAFSPGGDSLVKDADYDSAKFADSIVPEGGLGPLDAVKLRKSLAGKVAYVRPFIGELEEGLSGRASPSDLELMMQMTYLWFKEPRKDDTAFSAWRSRELESVKNRRLSPETTFWDEMMLLSSQNHRRRRPTTPEVVTKLDFEKAFAFYKDRFADADDFTFVFVGNVDLEKLKPLVETYLGSLPTKGRKETWRDVKVYWPNGVKTKTVNKGSEPKASVTLTFHGNEKWSRDTENDMRMLGEVLRIRLREVLREDMGGVYGVRAGGGISRRPRQEYTFNVSFGCSPDNVDKLEKAVFDEIKTIQDKGVGDDYIAKVKETRRRTHEVELKDNGFWLGELERAYRYGDDPKLIPDITEMTEKVSSDRVRAAAKKYLSNKQYVLGVLEPEGAAAPKAAAPAPAAAAPK